MDIKPIIVREYLSSLTENEELDYIFPILLESLGFVICSKPKEYKGLTQYGKDIVAVGIDFEDGIEKRFYFELKGGSDKNITESVFNKGDGIVDSLRAAKFRKFEFSNKRHTELPLKIVLVHNGEIKANIKEVYEGFINQEFPKDGDIEYDRWGISELTKYFSEKLFGAFLLTNDETTNLFNKVLVNLDVTDEVSSSFTELLDTILSSIKVNTDKNNLSRETKMLFESLRLISYIIYTESSKKYNNLGIAKKYLTHLVLKLWHWVLKSKIEENISVKVHVDMIIDLYLFVLSEYFTRTLPIAYLKDGLFSVKGGRYEEIGYTCRTFDYLQYLSFFLNLSKESKVDDITRKEFTTDILVRILNANNVSSRVLLDIHSIPIANILIMFIEQKRDTDAKAYISEILSYIINNKRFANRLPDANNNIRSVIKYIVSGNKPIYYLDEISPLLTMILEFIVILDMEDEYYKIRDFILEYKLDIGLFIPHHGENSLSKELIEDTENDLEEQLFSDPTFNDGYQTMVDLHENFVNERSYQSFKQLIYSNKNEFNYSYRTDKAGYSFLRELAHIYFRIPYFPDKWRYLL